MRYLKYAVVACGVIVLMVLHWNATAVPVHRLTTPSALIVNTATAPAPVKPQTIHPTGVLPDPAKTPGATNPDVTQANMAQNICKSGWTDTVRPPDSYTTALKVTQLAFGYNVGGDLKNGDYEEDHLISLQLGGSPTDPANLWPEPYTVLDENGKLAGARQKDVVETALKRRVCAGEISLSEAQAMIASDWYAVYLSTH